MSCNKIYEYLKGEINDENFRDHKKKCENCRELDSKDRYIMEKANRLNENIEVPDLWDSIEHEIHTNSEKSKQLFFRREFLLAAAATFLIVTALLWLTIDQTQTSTNRILSQKAMEKVITAENDYIQAINDLEMLAYEQLENTSHQLAQLYRNKLLLIDQQIRNCQEALQKNPSNSHIRHYLLLALKDKQTTLESILHVSS